MWLILLLLILLIMLFKGSGNVRLGAWIGPASAASPGCLAQLSVLVHDSCRQI